jgi:hypothetical protein
MRPLEAKMDKTTDPGTLVRLLLRAEQVSYRTNQRIRTLDTPKDVRPLVRELLRLENRTSVFTIEAASAIGENSPRKAAQFDKKADPLDKRIVQIDRRLGLSSCVTT